MNKAKLTVIQPGYAIWQKSTSAQKADGTITFVESGSHKIIVDTGLPKDKDVILEFIQKRNITPDEIDYVVCTHGDADHIGNINLFPKATLIIGFDIYKKDVASFFEQEYKIDKNVTIIKMTGHDNRSIGARIITQKGFIYITGDLFEFKNDWKKPEDWIAFSKNPVEQIINRAKIWQDADYIVPGHGNIFKVNKKIDIFMKEMTAFKNMTAIRNVYGDQEASL